MLQPATHATAQTGIPDCIVNMVENVYCPLCRPVESASHDLGVMLQLNVLQALPFKWSPLQSFRDLSCGTSHQER